jgi:hypothetical protein
MLSKKRVVWQMYEVAALEAERTDEQDKGKAEEAGAVKLDARAHRNRSRCD